MTPGVPPQGSATVRFFAERLGVAHLIDRALTYYPAIERDLWSTKVEITTRVSRTAGRATPGRITLHSALVHEGPQAFVQTFLHEVAHVMQYLVHGHFNHGESWWKMMHILDQKPIRTHRFQSAAFTRPKGGKREELSLDDLEDDTSTTLSE